MTIARETAEQIVDSFGYRYEHLATTENANALIAAIESALLAERERCAKICDDQMEMETDEIYISGITCCGVMAKQLATAIRSDEE